MDQDTRLRRCVSISALRTPETENVPASRLTHRVKSLFTFSVVSLSPSMIPFWDVFGYWNFKILKCGTHIILNARVYKGQHVG